MKKIVIFILISFFAWGEESFYDLYAKNRAKNIPNLITADFICSAYAHYKLSRESEVELKVLKPRVINFATYLYKGVVEISLINKKDAVAYSAVFSILANGGKGLVIPDGYEDLKDKIIKEVKLIVEAKKVAISPLTGKKIDYKKFAPPPKYKAYPNYYKAMRFAQVTPLPKEIVQTIKVSERLSNLYKYINEILEQFVGLSKNPNILFPPKETLDNIVFQNSPKPSIDDIAKVIYPSNSNIPSTLSKTPKKLQKLHKEIKQHILNLKSSYDYDWKIMQTLIQEGYISAFKGYYTQTKYRTNFFTKRVDYKIVKSKTVKKRTRASIEKNLIPTLNVMIEGALLFSTTISNNKTDLKMVEVLKEIRRVIQLDSLTQKDIDFLNDLDLIFLDIIGLKDKPISVWVAHGLVEELKEPKGFRYVHIERRL